MMMYKGICLLIAVTTMLMGCENRQLKVPISQAEINSSVTSQFPKKHKLYGQFKLETSNPKLTLKSTKDKRGQINLKMDLNVTRSPLPLTIKGQAVLTGKLHYDTATQTLFLKDGNVEQVDIKLPSMISTKEKGKLNQMASTVLKKQLSKIKLYKLDPKKHSKVTRSLLKDVTISDGKVYLHFGV